MNNWNTKTLPYGGTHQRSASTAGYHELLYPDYETVPLRNENRLVNQYCTSYMDISTTGDTYSDSRRQFSWRSPTNNQQSHLKSEKPTPPSIQRPFENAFKAAISKMKESSIYRLSDVNKSVKDAQNAHNNNEIVYNRNCTTLQPRKSSMDSRVSKPSHKVFRCNSTSDRPSDSASSVNSVSVDYVSETESERNIVDNQDGPVSKDVKTKSHFKNDNLTHQKNDKTNGFNSGSRVIIPAISSSQVEENRSVVSEAYISPTVVTKPQSSFPRTAESSIDNEGSPECEPLPSVQEIIAKVEALTNENISKSISKSFTSTLEKPPVKKPQRTGSLKCLESYSTPNQSEVLSTPGKRMSGLYKKTNPTPTKGTSLSNVPFDFQKLHSAFLEQKQEIQNLKNELDGKRSYIVQLESDIRAYEPWR